MARYIIFGAGAVGGLIGARLHLAGHAVSLVARGAHRDAMARDGLLFKTASTSDIIAVPVAADIAELAIGPDDIVIIGMKTQDSVDALDRLAAVAPPETAIVCAQNGIEGERAALRRFANVYGAYVYVFAGQTEAGIVCCYSAPTYGIIDIGRYPAGDDARAGAIAADLNAAGFSSLVRADIMAWKRAKLIVNTANAVYAACTEAEAVQDIVIATQDEARRCLDTASLAYPSSAAMADRISILTAATVDGRPFPGSSTLQSLMRGNPTTEVDYLNGEIALLGRQLGVATPVNSALQTMLRTVARDHAPHSLSAGALRAIVGMAS